MNLSQMHERLRLELRRRIRRGTLSVSLLSRQTGLGQSHLSNYLHGRRQLSMLAVDNILAAQRMSVADFLPANDASWNASDDCCRIPLVTHLAAMNEPHVRASSILGSLQVPAALIDLARSRVPVRRVSWTRFVAVSMDATHALPMDPILQPNAIVLLDRHYTSPAPYRQDCPGIYALRDRSALKVRYAQIALKQIIARPRNLACPVEILEPDPGESVVELIVGRVAFVLNGL